MTSSNSFISRYPVATFSILTIVLSFGAYLLPLPRQALPFLLVCIPALMAILLVAVTEGQPSVHSLLRKLTEWRIGFKWLGMALAVTIAMRLAISLIALVFGMIPSIQFRSGTPMEFVILAVIFLIAAILEELGWRGYVLPKLLETRSALFASLVIGVLWGLVHLVLHLPGMPANGLPVLPTLLQLIGLSIVLTWFFIEGGRNIILTSIVHASQSFFVIINGGVSLEAQQWLMAIVWMGAGAITVLASRSMQKFTYQEQLGKGETNESHLI